jgi:hypothetical protein
MKLPRLLIIKGGSELEAYPLPSIRLGPPAVRQLFLSWGYLYTIYLPFRRSRVIAVARF